MKIKAIDTEYDGHKFRSRLEARWAVFFNEMGWEYEYEPEGYILSDGTWYLPDFYLTEYDVYVEVKPTNKVTIKVLETCRQLARDLENMGLETSVLILDGTPENKQYIWLLSDTMLWAELQNEQDYILWFNDDVGNIEEAVKSLQETRHKNIPYGRYDVSFEENNSSNVEAYKIARQSRFEHGQTPKQKVYN